MIRVPVAAEKNIKSAAEQINNILFMSEVFSLFFSFCDIIIPELLEYVWRKKCNIKMHWIIYTIP